MSIKYKLDNLLFLRGDFSRVIALSILIHIVVAIKYKLDNLFILRGDFSRVDGEFRKFLKISIDFNKSFKISWIVNRLQKILKTLANPSKSIILLNTKKIHGLFNTIRF